MLTQNPDSPIMGGEASPTPITPSNNAMGASPAQEDMGTAPRSAAGPIIADSESDQDGAEIGFHFDGKLSTYYSIYLTNGLLTMVTLGFYAPWAKVRNKRYFYGNTFFNGLNFDFDASPASILIARLILIALYAVALYVETNWSLAIAGLGFVTLLFVFVLPILVVRGRAFNFRHSLLGNVRFVYSKTLWPSYVHLFLFLIPYFLAIFLGTVIAIGESSSVSELYIYSEFGLDVEFVRAAFTLLAIYVIITYPISHWLSHRIRISQLSFGKLQLRFAPSVWTYIGIYWAHLTIGLTLIVTLIFLVLSNPFSLTEETVGLLVMFAIVIPTLLAVIYSYFGFTAKVFWGGIHFGESSHLQANFNPFDYALRIQFVNIFLSIIVLLVPLARVRRWRYLCKNVTVVLDESLRSAISATENFETALGSEAVDMEGLDLDIGIV